MEVAPEDSKLVKLMTIRMLFVACWDNVEKRIMCLSTIPIPKEQQWEIGATMKYLQKDVEYYNKTIFFKPNMSIDHHGLEVTLAKKL